MFIGGCAGSTTCGIRMFRIQVLASSANAQLYRLLRPHSIVLPHYNDKPVPDNVTNAVMGFFFIYILAFAITASALSILGLDFETSISGAATAISNVGPGLGDQIGPSGNFSSLPFLAKWILCAAMILGRLELYTILILFTQTSGNINSTNCGKTFICSLNSLSNFPMTLLRLLSQISSS